MATHSSVLAWRTPGTAEPGGLPSVGLHRVGHDWRDLAAAAHLCLYFCLANKFISTIFLDPTFIHEYTIFVFFLLTYNSFGPHYKSLKWTLQFFFCKKPAQGGWEMHRCQSWPGLKLPLPGFLSSAFTHCRSQSSLKMRATYYSLILLKVYLKTWHRASVQYIFVERNNEWTWPEK